MRVGIDVIAVQAQTQADSEIGRYAGQLVAALLARDDPHEYLLYVHEDLPDHLVPVSERAEIRRLGSDGRSPTPSALQLDRLARTNPDALDVLLVANPFEAAADYMPPVHPGNGLKLVALVTNVFRFLSPREGVYDPALMRDYRILDGLRRYHALLASSDATRTFGIERLGFDRNRTVAIGAGCDARFFRPDRTEPLPDHARRTLRALGVTRPFVLDAGGFDERRNSAGLLEAFARLPEALRTSLQLVFACPIGPDTRRAVLALANQLGFGENLVLTGAIDDGALRVLYQRCAVFASASVHEGIGGSLLEALHCGAAIVAGNNSAQAEVVGDAGLLANVSDPNEIAAKLRLVVERPELARTLQERAVAQARTFSWEHVAERVVSVVSTLNASEAAPARRKHQVRSVPREADKPRIGFFSPLPPRTSGISDYSAFLLGELKQSYRIDLFHERGYVPEPALTSDDLHCFDVSLFPRYAAARDYHALIYQVGNSWHHTFMYDTLLAHPGVVTLHDFCLAGLHLYYGRGRGMEHELIRDELKLWYPDEAETIDAKFREWPWNWEMIVRECARLGWYLNKRVLDRAQRVIVHSPWCLRQVRAASAAQATKMAVIPHGIWPRTLAADERAAIRARFAIPRDALMIASFGFIHPDKMSPEALEAFRDVAQRAPSALFVFVGAEADGGEIRRYAESLGLSDRVRFLGRAEGKDFWDLGAVTDVGINLRRPPTHGETSGALLNLMASGVATIVTDTGTFSDYPDHAVRKVRWESEGLPGLRRAMVELATDDAARDRLGRAAKEHVLAYHEWAHVARQYAAEIERCHAELSPARGRSQPIHHRTPRDPAREPAA